MFKKIMLMIVGILLIYSCKENNTDVQEQQITSFYKVSNINNPYEIVGDLHSQGLEYIKNNYLNQINPNIVTDTNSLISNINEATIAFAKNIADSLYPNSNFSYSQIKSFVESQNIVRGFELIDYFNNLLNDPNYSTNEKYYFQEFYNVINSDSLENINYGDIVYVVSSKIIIYENNILNSTLSDNEKYHLFVFSAVLRDSYCYWFSELNNPNSAWKSLLLVNIPKNGNKLMLSKSQKEFLCHAGALATSDAWAGVVGASGGCMFGPGGAILTGTAAAIKGTLGGALIDGIFNAIKAWW